MSSKTICKALEALGIKSWRRKASAHFFAVFALALLDICPNLRKVAHKENKPVTNPKQRDEMHKITV